jgi:peptidoglycan/xylan/chitin deacetylase (PgdA/CDA1 family)
MGIANDRLNVALTFDDGYAEHYDIARTLHRRQIRATFFLITGLREWKNKTLLTLRPKLIRKMQEMNHEIASHTQSHLNLQTLTDEKVHSELQESKIYLEKLLDQEVEGFSYPFGKYDERISQIVASHYTYARAAGKVANPNRYELPTRNPGLSLRKCSLLMTGNMVRGRGFAILLLHSTNNLSVITWIQYMKLFRIHFVTLSELVEARYN